MRDVDVLFTLKQVKRLAKGGILDMPIPATDLVAHCRISSALSDKELIRQLRQKVYNLNYKLKRVTKVAT